MKSSHFTKIVKYKNENIVEGFDNNVITEMINIQ